VRDFAALGGVATLRLRNGQPLVTDNGMHLLDVAGLRFDAPAHWEARLSQWPGVVTVGLFAYQKAHVALLASDQGVVTVNFASPGSTASSATA
jgi:ribose 5-phosphate isomerase A